MAANPPTTIEFDSLDYAVSRSGKNNVKATVTVVRGGDPTSQVSVDYSTADLTAKAGVDYSPSQAPLTFAANETEKTFDVAILQNSAATENRVLVLDLQNPVQAQLGGRSKAVLTITPPARSAPLKRRSFQQLALPMLYVGVALAFIAFLWLGVLGKNSVIDELADVDTARGVITFLIVVATVAIGLILTLAGLLGTAPGSDKRFIQSKEIFTLLIGILGTIAGFYFGQAKPNPLQVATPKASAEKLKFGDNFAISATASGGKAPYRYDITFSPSSIIKDIKSKPSSDGLIIEVAEWAAGPLKEAAEVEYTILVKDDEGKEISKKGENKLLIQPSPPGAQAAAGQSPAASPK
jgi:succinate dehydrogenase hydrophobic anchor subunit